MSDAISQPALIMLAIATLCYVREAQNVQIFILMHGSCYTFAACFCLEFFFKGSLWCFGVLVALGSHVFEERTPEGCTTKEAQHSQAFFA